MRAAPLVYVFGPGSLEYKLMFLGEGWRGTNNPLSADLLCLTGGEDVNPALYGERALQHTQFNPYRDKLDLDVYHTFDEKPKVGICRGGQFLNVVNGGKMWQHVDRHTRNHELCDLEDGTLIPVSSTHHQMMRPNLDAQIVATAGEATSKVAANEWWKEGVTGTPGSGYRSDELFDTEVCYYNATRSLCFQPHPEYAGYDACRKYFFELLKRHFGMEAEAA